MKANGYRDVEMAELHQYTRDFSIKFWVISPYKNTCQYTKYCTKTQDGAGAVFKNTLLLDQHQKYH